MLESAVVERMVEKESQTGKGKPMVRATIQVVSGLMIVSWLLTSAAAFANAERNLPRGKKLYEKYCLACHGPQGRGDGTTQFDPPVADLTSSEVLMKPNSRLLKSIHQGRPNSAMDAWKSALSEEAIRDVLAYVLTFPR
jgi:mono/diheme cytochrome c family protein